MFWLLIGFIALSVLAYYRAGIRSSALVLGVTVLFYGAFGGSVLLFVALALAWVAVFLPLSVAPLRQEWITRPVLLWFRRVVQRLDPEVLSALDAGTASWEAELLDGAPDWQRFQAFAPLHPLPTEQAVVDNLVEGFRTRAALAVEAANYLRAQKAFGLGIDQRHGGQEWSALAQAAAIARIAAVDPGAAGRIANPQRLAWIELLRRHGLAAQCSRWLPPLAAGGEPLFSMEPLAGEASAVIAQHEGETRTVLRLRLDAQLTAGAAGAPLALQVLVRDPQALLGGHSGLACILLAGDEPGLTIANGGLSARGVEVGLDAVVGGDERIGCGGSDWAECLAIAHAIASPAMHAGAAAAVAAAAGGFARVHAPFSEALGQRALAQEALAMIGGREAAARAMAASTAWAVDAGERPQGLAGFARSIAAEHAADIAAAAGDLGLEQTALGPVLHALAPQQGAAESPGRLARSTSYTACVLRSHRAFGKALSAARNPNPALALLEFDAALWSHAGHVAASGMRALLLGLSGGGLTRAGGRTEVSRNICRRINRYSAALAFAADVALTRLSLDLASRRPRTARRAAHAAARMTLTTWLGDALAQLWLACCALKQFEDDGSPAGERAMLEWVCADALRSVEEALDKVLRHLSAPLLSALARLLIFPRGHAALAPSDAANRQIALLMQDDGRLRRRLAECGPRLAPLAASLEATLAGETLEKRLGDGAGLRAAALLIDDAAQAELIDGEQSRQLSGWLAAVRRLRRAPGGAGKD
jgi:acyl-CoA dehydrogenase